MKGAEIDESRVYIEDGEVKIRHIPHTDDDMTPHPTESRVVVKDGEVVEVLSQKIKDENVMSAEESEAIILERIRKVYQMNGRYPSRPAKDSDICVGNFQSYDDYLTEINSDEELMQKEARILESKHQSQKLSWAIGFVAALEEYNNYGLNELTPYMDAAFKDALNTLQESSDSSGEAKLYLQIGNDLAKYLTCKETSD